MYLRKPRRMGDGYGDIILAPSIQNRKIKKWIIGVSVAILLVVVLFIILWLTGVIGEDKESRRAREIAEFHEFLREPRDQTIDLASLVEYYYSGAASIGDFALSQEEYGVDAQMLEEGISAMESVSERLKKGPRLAGVAYGMDLARNYDGLDASIDESLDKYRAFVDLTLKLCEVYLEYDRVEVEDVLSDYNTDAIILGRQIKELLLAIDVAMDVIDNECSGHDSSECSEAVNTLYSLNGKIRDRNEIIPVVYRSNIGDIKSDGDDSVVYYMNNLSIATGVGDE